MSIGQAVSLRQLAALYLMIGLTGFGPAFLTETKKHLVKGRRWISEEDFVNGLALAQLLPGAHYVSLTVYIGYKLRGIAGAVTSFFAFLLPPFFLMVLLSHIYFAFGALPQIGILFKGLSVVVAGLLAHAVLEIGKSSVTDWRGAIIALGAVGVIVGFANIFLLLFMAATAGVMLYYPALKRQSLVADHGAILHSDIGAVNMSAKRLVLLAVTLAAIVFVASFEPVLFQLAAVFFRMGAVLFGGGPAMIPFIQQEVVNHYHWLTLDELMVGIALGQITPGPFLITATFVGYKVAAFRGAVAATLGMFLPSLFLVMATAETHQKIKHNLWMRSVIKGIAAAFAGMMLVVAVQLAHHSVVDMFSAVLAVIVFALLRFDKINVFWVVTGGTAIYSLVNILIIRN